MGIAGADGGERFGGLGGDDGAAVEGELIGLWVAGCRLRVAATGGLKVSSVSDNWVGALV